MGGLGIGFAIVRRSACPGRGEQADRLTAGPHADDAVHKAGYPATSVARYNSALLALRPYRLVGPRRRQTHWDGWCACPGDRDAAPGHAVRANGWRPSVQTRGNRPQSRRATRVMLMLLRSSCRADQDHELVPMAETPLHASLGTPFFDFGQGKYAALSPARDLWHAQVSARLV